MFNHSDKKETVMRRKIIQVRKGKVKWKANHSLILLI